MEWLGATWLLVRWRSTRRVVECNGKQGGHSRGVAEVEKLTDPVK